MPAAKLFLDSSVLVTGIASPTGAGRVLLLLGETSQVELIVSQQVITETERAIARKIPSALVDMRQAILKTKLLIVPDPPAELVQQHLDWISHAPDLPILLAAWQAKVDLLITLNRKHFIDDPLVAKRSGLLIVDPAAALSWLRSYLAKTW